MASMFCVMPCEAGRGKHKRLLVIAPSAEGAAKMASNSTGWPPSKYYVFEIGRVIGDTVRLWGGNSIPLDPVMALN